MVLSVNFKNDIRGQTKSAFNEALHDREAESLCIRI